MLFLGIAYLFVGAVDLLHTVSYRGINIFPSYGNDLATQLWIGARCMESLALLLAPLMPRRKVPASLIFASFALVTTLLLLSVFRWRIFPACFVANRLTLFKKTSEYVISATLLLSIGMMKTMLDGLRQVATAGYRVLRISHVDMNALVQRVIDTLAAKIECSGASLTVDDLPPCWGDPNQLTEVFANLLSNAVKYLDPNRKGHIRNSGRRDGDMNVYCVEDNGIGIAPQHREKVFELFGRIDPHGPVPGEGLGLMIVQKVVERHQGRVWFESEPGEGTRFFAALPRE